MPDRDGIEGPFTDGRSACACCGAWFMTHSPAERRHRRQCSRRWRIEYGNRRGLSAEERLAVEAISRSTETTD